MKKCTAKLISVLFLLYGADAFAIEVSFTAGDVFITREAKKTAALPGAKLKTDDVIKTGSKSFVSIIYEDGSEIKMSGNSSLKIGKMPDKSDSAPALILSGSVTTKFAKLIKDSDSSRKVYTPTTICAVRGTEFKVIVSDSAASRVELTEGSLDVRNPYGGQKIAAGTSMETGIAESPKVSSKQSQDAEEWMKGKDSEFDADIPERNSKLKTYTEDFSSRSNQSKTEIDTLKKEVKDSKDKDSLERAGKKLNQTNETIEDDYYLGDASANAIDRLATRFEKDKKDIRDAFLKLKKESNKVREQQRRNYEAIRAVKESYQKSYDQIISKHEDSKRKIKEGVDLQKVKPVMDKK